MRWKIATSSERRNPPPTFPSRGRLLKCLQKFSWSVGSSSGGAVSGADWGSEVSSDLNSLTTEGIKKNDRLIWNLFGAMWASHPTMMCKNRTIRRGRWPHRPKVSRNQSRIFFNVGEINRFDEPNSYDGQDNNLWCNQKPDIGICFKNRRMRYEKIFYNSRNYCFVVFRVCKRRYNNIIAK